MSTAQVFYLFLSLSVNVRDDINFHGVVVFARFSGFDGMSNIKVW